MVLTRAARWPIIALLSVLTIVVVVLGLAIQANTDRLELAVYDQCRASQHAAVGTNTVLDTLIAAVTLTNSIPSAEKTDRVAKYEAAKQTIPVCVAP